MFRRPRSLLTAFLLSPLVLFGTASLAQAAEPAPGDGGEGESQNVQRAVSFEVQNVNNTDIPCEADGETYTVRGHITGPEEAMADPQSVTLFLHGLSYGEFFTTYGEQPGYNFAQKQADAGHITVTVDRLGYDSSDMPAGGDICFGSRADIAHQMVLQLRSGEYQTEDSDSAAFENVVLAGHSVGSIIAQAAAYSFGDIDGLMVLSYSDQTVSDAAMTALEQATAKCEAGGTQAEEPEGPDGYVYFGETQETFVMAHFFTENAEPEVVETTANLRNRDPCGDVLSYLSAVETNLANVGEIDVPTLVLIGTEDAIYPTDAADQASLLTGVEDLSTVNLAATGHAVTLHNSRNEFSSQVSNWLYEHGFASSSQMADIPVGGADTGVARTPSSAGATGSDRPAAGLLALGGIVLAATGGAYVIRRHAVSDR